MNDDKEKLVLLNIEEENLANLKISSLFRMVFILIICTLAAWLYFEFMTGHIVYDTNSKFNKRATDEIGLVVLLFMFLFALIFIPLKFCRNSTFIKDVYYNPLVILTIIIFILCFYISIIYYIFALATSNEKYYYYGELGTIILYYLLIILSLIKAWYFNKYRYKKVR